MDCEVDLDVELYFHCIDVTFSHVEREVPVPKLEESVSFAILEGSHDVVQLRA